jgi:hypothetical protein
MDIRLLSSLLLVALLSRGPACGAATIIVVDEFGNGFGTIGGGTLMPDPGPGGLPSVLTYTLPFSGTQGDVLLLESGLPADVIRFNGNGTLAFYSALVPGQPASPADTPTPPRFLYPNVVVGTEVVSDGDEFAPPYTPQSGQPGYNSNFQPTYFFISSDLGSSGPVPAPPSLFMGATAALAGVGYWRYALSARRPGGWGFRTARRTGRASG